MNKSRLIFYRSEIWLIIICSICLQMPDVKIGSVKLPEILILSITPFFFVKIFKYKTLFYFFLFYIFFFIKTIILNFTTKFYINTNLPILKLPYLISFSRLIEMITCIVFCLFIVNSLKISKDPLMLIKKILFVQIFCFGSVYIFVFLLYQLRLLQTTSYDTLIVYDASLGNMNNRLKGFYVEGGPFGLFCAFLFTFCVALYNRLNLTPSYLILCFILVICAQSKAGYVMLLLTCITYLGLKFSKYLKYTFFKIIFYLVLSITSVYSFSFIASSYIEEMTTLEVRSSQFSSQELDPNLMMGRISASVIVPNMIVRNLFFGIGWGNYPLLRNNPDYRLFMPEIPVNLWDNTGLGGLIDLLIEGGLLFLIIYFLLYYRIHKHIIEKMSQSIYFTLALIGPLLLGVTIYFFYTWLLLGVIIFLQIDHKS